MTLQAAVQAFNNGTHPHAGHPPRRCHCGLSLSQWRGTATRGQVEGSVSCQEFLLLKKVSAGPDYGTCPVDDFDQNFEFPRA